MISSKEKKYNDYKSFLKEYLFENHNYDNSNIIYTDRYGAPAFTTTVPNSSFKNCEFVNNYPHFQIPSHICLREIKNFIEGTAIYDDNFTIRYGDIHPNKPIPMLGQLRNYYIDDAIKNMIMTTGKVNNIFTIGDISSKTINKFLDKYGIMDKDIMFDFIYKSIINRRFSLEYDSILKQYDNYCDNSILLVKNLLKVLQLESEQFLKESKLYYNNELYNYIKSLKSEDGLKSNGEIKYFLQEFMFLLNPSYSNGTIINIIGSDQSEHIKKVLTIVKDNNIDCDVNFLTYNICKNSSSRDINEWEKILNIIVKENNITLDSKYVLPFDFLRFYFSLVNNINIIDFQNLKNININMIDEIYRGVLKSKLNLQRVKNSISQSCLLSNMTLINQVINSVVSSGETSKLVKYLYGLSREYNRNSELYCDINELYYEFMIRCLQCLSFDKTESIQNLIKRK